RGNRARKSPLEAQTKKSTLPSKDVPPLSHQKSQKWIGWIGLALTVFGVVIGLPSVLPAISFAIVYYDDAYPLLTPFPVTNSGLLTVRNVQFVCKLNNIAFEKGHGFERLHNMGITSQYLISSKMSPRDTFDIVCPLHELFKDIENIGIIDADMDIIV